MNTIIKDDKGLQERLYCICYRLGGVLARTGEMDTIINGRPLVDWEALESDGATLAEDMSSLASEFGITSVPDIIKWIICNYKPTSATH